MHHHALAPVSLDPGDFWHSWELLFQSFSVGLTFIRMNWAGEVQLAQKPPWRHPLFHERRSDAYCISFQGPPGRRHQNPFNLFVRWRNPDTKVDHPRNQWTAKVPQLWSPGCSLLPASGQLWPLRQPHIHTCCETRTNDQIWEICWKCLRIESALPCFFRTGLLCLNFPGKNTPSGSRRLITSNKGRPRCDPSRPECLYLQSQRGQICHPACSGSRALSLLNGLAFPESHAWRLEPSLVALLGRVHF